MDKASPVLYIFSGLPGVGKSTLASALAEYIGATYLRIDAIEQGLRDIYQTDVYDEGYKLAFRMAADSLRQELTVVGDSCNSIAESRDAWKQVAIETEVSFINIEIVCTNVKEHRKRLETRQSVIKNLVMPTWKNVLEREYQPWKTEVLSIDTANQLPQHSITKLISLLNL